MHGKGGRNVSGNKIAKDDTEFTPERLCEYCGYLRPIKELKRWNTYDFVCKDCRDGTHFRYVGQKDMKTGKDLE